MRCIAFPALFLFSAANAENCQRYPAGPARFACASAKNPRLMQYGTAVSRKPRTRASASAVAARAERLCPSLHEPFAAFLTGLDQQLSQPTQAPIHGQTLPRIWV